MKNNEHDKYIVKFKMCSDQDKDGKKERSSAGAIPNMATTAIKNIAGAAIGRRKISEKNISVSKTIASPKKEGKDLESNGKDAFLNSSKDKKGLGLTDEFGNNNSFMNHYSEQVIPASPSKKSEDAFTRLSDDNMAMDNTLPDNLEYETFDNKEEDSLLERGNVCISESSRQSTSKSKANSHHEQNEYESVYSVNSETNDVNNYDTVPDNQLSLAPPLSDNEDEDTIDSNTEYMNVTSNDHPIISDNEHEPCHPTPDFSGRENSLKKHQNLKAQNINVNFGPVSGSSFGSSKSGQVSMGEINDGDDLYENLPEEGLNGL